MTLIEIKNTANLTNHVEFVKENETIKEVIFFSDDKEVHVRIGRYSDGLHVFIREDFKEEEKFLLEGTLADGKIQINQIFDTQDAADEILETFGSTRSAVLKITPIKVLVDENGQAAGLSDIRF